MVEKRSETRATKSHFSRLSFHFSLPINLLCPSLHSLTRQMSKILQSTVLQKIEHRDGRGKSNNSPQSDGFAAAGFES
jgi:hypothetical protein